MNNRPKELNKTLAVIDMSRGDLIKIDEQIALFWDEFPIFIENKDERIEYVEKYYEFIAFGSASATKSFVVDKRDFLQRVEDGSCKVYSRTPKSH